MDESSLIWFHKKQDSRREDKCRRAEKKEKAADKTIEQAEAVKEAAREVRKTCEFVRDTGSSVRPPICTLICIVMRKLLSSNANKEMILSRNLESKYQ